MGLGMRIDPNKTPGELMIEFCGGKKKAKPGLRCLVRLFGAVFGKYEMTNDEVDEYVNKVIENAKAKH